jgi:hypothetical protein
MKPCPGCGIALENNIVVCPDCGESQDREVMPAPQVPSADKVKEQRRDDRWLLINYSIFPCMVGLVTGVGAVAMWGPAGVFIGLAAGVVAFLIALGADLI